MIYEVLSAIFKMFIEMAPYMMFGLIFVGILHIYVTKDFVAKQLGKRDLKSVFKAALFGVPLPLCSCGVIPTSVFMYQNGASKGSTASFLISTPQTGIDSIIATYGMMGWFFAIYRPIAAFMMGIIGGIISHNFDSAPKNKQNAPTQMPKVNLELRQFQPKITLKQKLKSMADYAFIEFLDDIAIQFILGVTISGLIYYFVPADIFAGTPVASGVLGMLAMIVIGVPMYICATASIPIAVTLMLKGFSPGVAFVFLAVGPATNAASIAILSNSIGKKFTTVFLISIIISSISFGLLLDWLVAIFAIDYMSPIAHFYHHDHSEGILINNEIKLLLAGIFFILLSASVYRKYLRKFFKNRTMENTKQKINIEGMTCNHCVANVKKAISQVDGVSNVDVVLDENAAYVEGQFDIIKLKQSIEVVGYKVV